MMFQIVFDHFIRDIARPPRAVSDCPKVIAPISLFQIWKFRLKQPRRATCQTLNRIRKCQLRRILNVHLNVVFGNYARQNANIFSIADLHEQIAASHLYITFQNVIAIFGCPHQMDGQSRNCLMSVSVVFHLPQFSHEILAEAN